MTGHGSGFHAHSHDIHEVYFILGIRTPTEIINFEIGACDACWVRSWMYCGVTSGKDVDMLFVIIGFRADLKLSFSDESSFVCPKYTQSVIPTCECKFDALTQFLSDTQLDKHVVCCQAVG